MHSPKKIDEDPVKGWLKGSNIRIMSKTTCCTCRTGSQSWLEAGSDNPSHLCCMRRRKLPGTGVVVVVVVMAAAAASMAAAASAVSVTAAAASGHGIPQQQPPPPPPSQPIQPQLSRCQLQLARRRRRSSPLLQLLRRRPSPCRFLFRSCRFRHSSPSNRCVGCYSCSSSS